MEYLFIILIILVSAFIQGFSGFAFSLVLIPLLGLFFPFQEVIVLNLLFSFVLNLSVFVKLYKHAKIKELLVLIVFALIFTVVGSMFVKSFDETLLKIVLGSLLIISSLISIFKINVTLDNPSKFYPVVGSIAGFLNGLSSIAGPPLIIFFANTKMDKLTYKATFNAIFLSLNIIALISYSYFKILTIDLLQTGLIYAIFVVIGAYVGLLVSYKVSEKLFKQIILYIILIMGISMIVGEL